MDAVYPDGPGGVMVLSGRGRDLFTPRRGDPVTVAEASVEVTFQPGQGPTVASIRTDPQVEVGALVGRVASSGFRAAVEQETSAQPGTLVYLLLDEIPAATLVGGYSVMHAVGRGDLAPVEMGRRRPPGPVLQVPDLCAGFQVGGVIMTEFDRSGRIPQAIGPIAPEINDTNDPWAWHPIGPTPIDGVRRWRRVDVEATVSAISVEAFFRDSHAAPDGAETVLHEYVARATADAAGRHIVACAATPHVLPWHECPQAAASAARLAGVPFDGLRHHVRSQLVGTSSCTHLNDCLRGLEDVPHLAMQLA
jgi:Protein of unknown function (DUF2889)